MATLNSKEIKERSKADEDNGEGLCVVRRRTDHRDSRQSRGKSRSKSRGGRIKCYICQSEDHLKINYPKNNHKKSTGYVKKDEQPSSSGSTYNDSELGDNKECKIRGIGKVKIQLRDGSSFVLHNVMYIPELKRNLILLGTLEKRGFTVKLQSGKVKVINGFRVVLSGIRRDNCVYSLDGHAMEGAGKAGAIWQEKSWFKRKAFRKFKEWKRLVENQTGRAVKKMRTDNGLEFCNREFKQLCIESGIARHLTVVGTSQQNRLAECMNITLIDKVRCLLIQSELLKTFWVEATCTTAYLINRFRDESNMATYAFVALEEEDTHELFTYQEAVACEDSSKCKAAMKEKMDSLRKNKTWELVDHSAGQKLVSCKWLFKIKEGIEGVQKPRYKARLVILALTACKDYELEQLDVKTSPRQWYKRFDEYMLSNGFKRSISRNFSEVMV
nr:hypothetical protein [Tanacetum cinerariifolium]